MEIPQVSGPGAMSTGRQFIGEAGGRWAAARFETHGLNVEALRTLDTLRRDEWVEFDNVLVEEGLIRMPAVGDLMSRGLSRTIANGIGKTAFEYERVGDMTDAIMSMTGLVRSDNDRVEFDPSRLPLPLTHKDFFLDRRQLAASRERGEPLDTLQARIAGRKVSELVEYTLLTGSTKQYGGVTLYGYTTMPQRVEVDFTDNKAWDDTTKTGADYVNDILAAKRALAARRFHGPYMVYIPGDGDVNLDKDYSTVKGEGTIRSRIMQINGIQGIQVSDQLATGNVVVVQMTPDVVQMIVGENLQTIQWDVQGGFGINFKAFTIMVPILRYNSEDETGIAHIHQL
jgi:uncharacterized linocin/CFP29 family protein